jgi:hypothetical protein
MLTYLTRLTAERDSLTQAANDITERAARDERDVTETERQSLATMAARCGEIDGQLRTYSEQAESQRAYASLRANMAPADDEAPPSRAVERRAPQPPAQPESWGELFVRSAAFETYPGAGSSQRVEVPFELEQRAAIGIGTFPDQGLPPYYWTPAQYTYASPLLGVVGKVSTSAGAVSYVQWAPNPQGAAPVAGEGTLKVEATMSATGVSQSLVTWAHWKEITRQALEDIPQIRSIVEGRLRQGLVRAVEDSIVDNLIAATLPPVTGSAAGGDTLLGVIRQGVATVQAAGYANPNAVVLNPADYADLDIAIMSGTLGGPTSAANYWGLRPIASNGVPAGTAWVGDFSVGVTLFTRGTAAVYLSDSHADNFIRNVLLLLAETRGLAVVTEPAAIAECTVGA